MVLEKRDKPEKGAWANIHLPTPANLGSRLASGYPELILAIAGLPPAQLVVIAQSDSFVHLRLDSPLGLQSFHVSLTVSVIRTYLGVGKQYPAGWNRIEKKCNHRRSPA